VGAIELTALLWREREALQTAVERQQQLLEALRESDGGAVDDSLAALARALDELRPVILERDIEITALADDWGVLTELTVALLPRFAPPGPWSRIFADHLDALTDLATRAVATGRTVDELLLRRGVTEGMRLPVSRSMYTGSVED